MASRDGGQAASLARLTRRVKIVNTQGLALLLRLRLTRRVIIVNTGAWAIAVFCVASGDRTFGPARRFFANMYRLLCLTIDRAGAVHCTYMSLCSYVCCASVTLQLTVFMLMSLFLLGTEYQLFSLCAARY